MAFWTCPSCGRRVPGYSPACHCGVTQTASTALPTPRPLGEVRFSWRELPWQVWAAIGVAVLALGFGLWGLFRPNPPEYIVPLLGVAQRRHAPTPKPSPSPVRTR